MIDGDGDDKPFLSRWSERKRAVQAEEEGAPDDAPSSAGDAASSDASPEELEANRKAAEAIDLESLTDKSDYLPFFKAGVPAALTRAALRKLWRSNPVFAVLDGLNDYEENFAWPTPGSEVVRSAWKVGKGYFEDDADAEGGSTPAPDGAEAKAAEPLEEAKTADVEVTEPVEEPEAETSAPVASTEEEEASTEEDPEQPIKVGLAKRLDFAAFAKESDS